MKKLINLQMMWYIRDIKKHIILVCLYILKQNNIRLDR